MASSNVTQKYFVVLKSKQYCKLFPEVYRFRCTM